MDPVLVDGAGKASPAVKFGSKSNAAQTPVHVGHAKKMQMNLIKGKNKSHFDNQTLTQNNRQAIQNLKQAINSTGKKPGSNLSQMASRGSLANPQANRFRTEKSAKQESSGKSIKQETQGSEPRHGEGYFKRKSNSVEESSDFAVPTN